MGIYRLSFMNLRRRKLRSVLTMLGIVIGVSTLVLLVGLGAGMTSSIKEQTESLMGDIIITKGGTGQMAAMGPTTTMESNMNPDLVSRIKQNPQLFDIKEYVTFISEIKNTPIMVQGTNDWDQVKIEKGNSGVVIDQDLADNLGYKIGDKIKIKDQEMVITGIATKSGGILYVDIKKTRPLTDNKISMLSARTRGDPKVISKELENSIKDVDVLTKSDISEEIDKMTQSIMLFIGAVASVGLIVGVISIVNTMLINVMERTRELGILKAIGFTNREIMGSTLLEAALLGFFGAILGVALGVIAIIILSKILNMRNVSSMFPLWLILGVIGGVTLLSVLAGLYPAWRASKLNVVEALRYE